MTPRRTIGALALSLLAISASAAPAAASETLRYDWRLRGALSWIAGLRFPTSGTGVLLTSPRAGSVESELRVNAGGHGHLEYRSVMEASARRTLSSENGYTFGSKSHRKETVYDYSANLARLSERKEGETETRTRPLPFREARDVLTTIVYLRENAASIAAPVTTDVFADGKPYRVIIRPEGLKSAEWQGRQVPARVFSVTAAPGQKKKFPGLTVWISEDAQRLPLRIILDQQYASLDLRLRAG